LKLERAQTGLLAALAATASISIFASETLLALSLLVLAARLVRRQVRLESTIGDTPLAAFAVWTLLAASFAADPTRSHEDAKKLVLFTLFYVALEVMARDAGHQRVLSAVLLGASRSPGSSSCSITSWATTVSNTGRRAFSATTCPPRARPWSRC